MAVTKHKIKRIIEGHLETDNPTKYDFGEVVTPLHEYYVSTAEDLLERITYCKENIENNRKGLSEMQQRLDNQIADRKWLRDEYDANPQMQDILGDPENGLNLIKQDISATTNTQNEYEANYQKYLDKLVLIFERLCQLGHLNFDHIIHEPSVEEVADKPKPKKTTAKRKPRAKTKAKAKTEEG